jgi:IMP dehydrogenase/GMP reductase
MSGKMFAECRESLGKSEFCCYYGQSSNLGQKDRFGEVRRAPEGIERYIKPKYNLATFLGQFEASLRSAMSYANAKTLGDFVGKVETGILSEHEFNAFNK